MSEALHSEDWITEDRLEWWNADYLDLLARRIGARRAEARSLADFGCGEGHWTQLVATALPRLEALALVDMESEWLRRGGDRLDLLFPRMNIERVCADARYTGLADESFDLVTAQTLLLHVVTPLEVIMEMKRVLRPGGCVLLAEPVNSLNASLFFELAGRATVEQRVALMDIWLRHVARNRETKGDHDIGLRLPELLEAAGFVAIEAFQNDRIALRRTADFDIGDIIAQNQALAETWEFLDSAVMTEELRVLRDVRRTMARSDAPDGFVLEPPGGIVCLATKPPT